MYHHIMELLTEEERDGLWALYQIDCERNDTRPTIKDFSIWLVEEAYIDD